ncbi:MAG TPA: thiamine pyrophosphate-dependent enzyme [Gammaproteobacteria bacterium]|nr:thiamine pyrophosphate-dependent enzyme [Gammaproteobacteria bacterium]
MSRHTVSDLILEILAETGVRQIFGIPGDAINGLVDAVRRQTRIEFIQVRHEEAGAFAASAQAKLTGRLAVCVGTAGPGAIHLLNGLYDANRDHAPVLAITGQVDTTEVGTDYHQEVDLYTLFKDVAAFNQVVMRPEQLPRLIVQACRTALAHRTVAHLSLPVDVAKQPRQGDRRHAPVQVHRAATLPAREDLEAAAELLNRSRRVVILAGIGCQGAREELIALADRLGAPVVRSLRARDVIPDEHELSAGGIGALGGRPAVQAMAACDALLLVGTDFPYRDFFPEDAPAVQIDIDPTRIGKRYPVEVGLTGDAGLTLKALTERVRRREDRDFLEKTQARMRDFREDNRKAERSDQTPIRPQRLAATIGELARDDAVFTCDTGTVTIWAARHLRLRGEQRFTLSSSLASMAFAMPAAIGAQLAWPDRQVIALAGDGGLAMLMGDFVTAVKYHLPINVVVFNNSKLGLIRMEEEAEGIPDFQTDLLNPDFAAFARACGGAGFAATDPAELEGTLRQAFDTDAPTIVDVKINADELPLPPKIHPSQALGYGIARTKELFGG